jgi:hypothetical protein
MFESLAQRDEGKMSKPFGLVLLVGAVFVVAIWVLVGYLA